MLGSNTLGWAYIGDAYAGTVAGNAWTLSLSDTATLSESAAKAAVIAKSDTSTLTDATAKTTTLAKAEPVTLSDAVAKTFGIAKSDTVTVSDLIAKALTLSEAETLTLAEQISKGIGVDLDETLTAADLAAFVATFLLSLVDTVTVTDHITTPGSDVVVVGGGHAVVRDTSPAPRHFALSLEDKVVLQDAKTFQHEPDLELEDFFSHLEALLERNLLIPA